MYELITKFGMNYKYIHSWTKWDLDDRFLVFQWGKSSKKELIIRIDDIQSIEGV